MDDMDPKDEAQYRLRNLCELYNLVEGGVYRHYKGNLYVVKALSVHESTLELLVTYRSNRRNTTYTRTLANFVESVQPDGTGIGTVQRFRRVEQ